MVKAGEQNYLQSAAGSVGAARAAISSFVQGQKITSTNMDEIEELLAIRRKLEAFQCGLEVKARLNGG